jgi:Na+/alanine symporter
MTHFAGRKALDLEGLDDAVARKLVETGLATSVLDLFQLTGEQLANLLLDPAELADGRMSKPRRFGEKKASLLITSLERARTQPLHRWIFGLVVAIIVGLVIIGGIKRIAEVTSRLVPLMTILYVIGCLVVFLDHWDKIGETFRLIVTGAFNMNAVAGGVLGVMLIGIQRAAFSNEAGVGSAPIAHAAAKTRYPASEGVVALLEPFIDTVVICTMTALVVICTGDYLNTGKDGITITSDSFSTVIPWFKYVLSAAVILFALSTLITWSYYGLQAWKFLFGKSNAADVSYKILFCGVIVIGAAMAPGNVIDFSDAVLLAMCFPNLIGVYFLLPVVTRELALFKAFTKRVDAGESVEAADAHVRSSFPAEHPRHPAAD